MYFLFYGVWYSFSLLPWRFFYLISDFVLYPFVYYILKYRLKIVRRNIVNSFPEKSKEERLLVEKNFYHWFCDCIVEGFKQISMSPKEIERHMKIEGIVECEQELLESPNSMAVMYIGHYANWEWLTAAGLQLSNKCFVSQIYHPLHNKILDRIIYGNRSKCGIFNVPMKDAIRVLKEKNNQGVKTITAFVADQSPRVHSIFHRMNWLNQDTPVITGPEFLGSQIGALYYYTEVVRLRRGYYHAVVRRLHPILNTPYPYTEAYMRELEKNIHQTPQMWLWTHNRWKFGKNIF